MKKDYSVSFTLRLSEMLIIISALNALEIQAIETFNKEKRDFYSLEQIIERTKSYKDLLQLKKIFHTIVAMKEQEKKNEKK